MCSCHRNPNSRLDNGWHHGRLTGIKLAHRYIFGAKVDPDGAYRFARGDIGKEIKEKGISIFGKLVVLCTSFASRVTKRWLFRTTRTRAMVFTAGALTE
jgi:hypothetical protein